jgi:hypothetical protein
MVNEPEIKAFISRVHRELNDINEKLETFQHRKKELEELIIKCKTVFHTDDLRQLSFLNSDVAPHSLLSRSVAQSVEKTFRKLRSGKKIWEQIVDLLKEVEMDLSISDIVQGFHERGWPLSEKNAAKILYRAMKDKPTLFINTNRGTWDLKKRLDKVQPPPLPPRKAQ